MTDVPTVLASRRRVDAAVDPHADALARRRLPDARGPLSSRLLGALVADEELGSPAVDVEDPLADDDLHLALSLAYALHYRGLPGVDDRREWDPSILAFRAALEDAFEGALREQIGAAYAADVAGALRDRALADPKPSLSRYLEREATLAQFREFVIHRSAYHLMEADPHSFAIPRLHGRTKAALVEIQADEYGGGDAERMHSRLFAGTMLAMGLDPTLDAYLDRIPGVTLATVNLVSMFGLHRRLRGALVGHLGLFELTSSIPNLRYGNGLRRLGFDRAATDFFDEHVEADAVHGAIASQDLAGSFAEGDPDRASEVLFGADALGSLEARVSAYLLERWGRGGLEPARGWRAMSGEPSVRCYPDGPFLVRGPVKVLDDEGKEIEISRSVVALCRCGHSRKQPLCDGTHAAAGFRVTTDAEPERAR